MKNTFLEITGVSVLITGIMFFICNITSPALLVIGLVLIGSGAYISSKS